MRAMRSLLVLFCLLVQFAIVEAANDHVVHGCGTTYSCYVPEHCSTGTLLKESTEVIEIGKSIKIIDTCLFLLRVHGFSTNWVHVSMESMDASVKSMEFHQTTGSGSNTVIRTFSCASGNIAKYTKNGKEHNIETSNNLTPDDRVKFQCAFGVKLDSEEHVIDSTVVSKVKFMITRSTPPEEAVELSYKVDKFLKCDPGTFAYNMSIEANQKFAELKSEPSHYYCENPEIFKLTYRQTVDKNYEPVTDIKCEMIDRESGLFVVNTNRHVDEAPVDIRCAADAKFFCKYAPNAKKNMKTGEGPMDYTAADWNQMTPSSLKCPDDKPYLFIGGNFFPDPSIECRNYGGTEYWTVNLQHRLTQTGLETHCSATIDCALKYKIPDGSVEKGTLDTKNLPVCYNEQGVLHVGNEISSNVTCDYTTGDFKYKIGGVEKIVDKSTKFRCEYPVVDDVEANKKNQNILMGVGVGAIVICVCFVGGCTTFATYRMNKHIKKMNEKHKKEAFERFQQEELKFNKFARHENEILLEIKKKKAKAEGINVEDVELEEDALPQAPDYADPSRWSALVMDYRCISKKCHEIKTAEKAVGPGYAPGSQAAVRTNQYLSAATMLKVKSGYHYGRINEDGKDIEGTKINGIWVNEKET